MGRELLDAHACPLNVPWLGGLSLCVKRPSPCSELKVCVQKSGPSLQPCCSWLLKFLAITYYLSLGKANNFFIAPQKSDSCLSPD